MSMHHALPGACATCSLDTLLLACTHSPYDAWQAKRSRPKQLCDVQFAVPIYASPANGRLVRHCLRRAWLIIPARVDEDDITAIF